MNANVLDWLPRLREGDPAAIEWCYRAHAGVLLLLATRLLGERADAEDVIQELFVELPGLLARYEERGAFAAWLRQLTTRRALVRQRQQRRRREVPSTAAELAVHRDPRAIVSDESLLVERALASLSDPLRQVFVLRVLEGHSHAEIAALLAISVGTSEMRLSRALKALRGLLGEQA